MLQFEKVDTGVETTALSADLTDGFILVTCHDEPHAPDVPDELHLLSLYRFNGENPVNKVLFANRRELDQFLDIAADSRHVDKLNEWVKVAKTAIWSSIVRRFNEKVAEEIETGYRLPWE